MAAKKQLLKKLDTPKVVKDAKPNAVEPPAISDEEYRCTCCGHKYKKQERNFNRSKSPIYKGNNGYLSICQRCIAELYEQYVGNEIGAVWNIVFGEIVYSKEITIDADVVVGVVIRSMVLKHTTL